MDTRESLVELIFTKCNLVYGRDFLGRWEGQRISEVKADWMRELGALLDNPQAVRHALMHLPDEKPPTVLAFRNLCVGPPGDRHDKPLRLAAPSASPAVIAAVKAVAKGPKSDVDPKSWAWNLRKREHMCERLTPAQRSMWREALKEELKVAA